MKIAICDDEVAVSEVNKISFTAMGNSPVDFTFCPLL